MNYKAPEIKTAWPKHRPWNVALVPKKLEELAKSGVYFESRLID